MARLDYIKRNQGRNEKINITFSGIGFIRSKKQEKEREEICIGLKFKRAHTYTFGQKFGINSTIYKLLAARAGANVRSCLACRRGKKSA